MTALRMVSVVLALFAIAIGCASTSQPERTEYELDLSGGEGADEEEQRQHWWGPIQQRADDANDELGADIEACLQELGSADEIREIGVEARRDDETSHYALSGVTAHPADADEHDCVEAIAEDYVEAVGTVIGDDFDTWVATFVHRGALSGADSAVEVDSAVSSELGADVQSGDTDVVGQCSDPAQTAVDQAIRDRRDCWSGGRFQERMLDYEERPLELRAVIFGDIIVGDGTPRLLLGYNRPWVEPMVSCVVDGIDGDSFDEVLGDEPCRAQLHNRAVTLWFGPSFTYMYGDQ